MDANRTLDAGGAVNHKLLMDTETFDDSMSH